MNKTGWQHWLVRMIKFWFSGVILLSFLSLALTWRSWRYYQQGQLEQTKQTVTLNRWALTALDWLTAKQTNLIPLWNQGLLLAEHSLTFIDQVSQFATNNLNLSPTTSASTLPSLISQLEQTKLVFRDFARIYLRSGFTKFVTFNQEFILIKQLLEDGITLANYLNAQSLNYLAIWQNTHELRPSGGFMGSYAVLSLNQGQLTSLEIQDIYAAAGQFHGYVEPPPGVKAYLSEGKSWQLPDANWHADFSQSAQTILSFFALSQQSRLDGVVAVNLDLVEEILKLTGPIYLPDYQINVTAANLADQAGADRVEFFPGSQQKRNFLASLTTQLRLQFSQLDRIQQCQLLKLILTKLTTKDIQLYSQASEIQALWQKYHVAGVVPNHPRLLLWLEANVGINKTNQNIYREAELEFEGNQAVLTMSLTNQNQPPVNKNTNPYLLKADHLGYVNYQRIIIPNDAALLNLEINGENLESIQQQKINNYQGDSLSQYGFLLTIPEQNRTVVTAVISYPAGFNPPFEIFLPHQSGLPATSLKISYQDRTAQFTWDRDTLVVLNKQMGWQIIPLALISPEFSKTDYFK